MSARARIAHLTLRSWLAATAVFAGVEVRGIGPENQLVAPTFDGVVRILYDNPGNQDAGDGYMNGTGSIIGNHNVNGQGWLCVLTADHVVSTTGRFGGALVSKPGIAFGNSNKVTGNSPYTAASSNVKRYGFNGTSDYAVMAVPYGAFDPFYNSLVRNLITASAFFPFTDIGYGNEGRLVDQFAPAGNDGYQSQGVYGTQRYLNDKIGSFATEMAMFTSIGYVYKEAAIWYIDNPAGPVDAPGSGTTYDADSGSPYFSSEADFDEANGISYFTNNQFAVHTGTDLTNNPAGAPMGYKAFGVQNFGVALTQDDINWIRMSCRMIIPEPASVTLLVFALMIAVGFARRRI